MSFIKSFFTTLLATVVAIFVSSFLFIVAVSIFVGVLVSQSGDSDKPHIKQNSILKLSFKNFSIQDYDAVDSSPIDGLLDDAEIISISDIRESIIYAANDPKIKAISIETDFRKIDFPYLNIILDAIDTFKLSKKPVWAYGDSYSQTSYVLSSVADNIYMSSIDRIDLRGISISNMYLKDFFSKIGVEFMVYKRGKYKSAVEPYSANNMSPNSKYQLEQIANQYWNEYLNVINDKRGISKKTIDSLTNLYSLGDSKNALKYGFIDGIIYKDEYKDSLEAAIKIIDTEKTHWVKLGKYASFVNIKQNEDEENSGIEKKEIAVLYAQGTIMEESGMDEVAINNDFLEGMDDIYENEEIKGLVLRVNSPGGSGTLSEKIWRKIEKIKEKMPVVVSMGKYAASGGYYIASGAEQIFAERTTLTGSIGVFGIFPNIKKLLDKGEIHRDVIKTHEMSDVASLAVDNVNGRWNNVLDKGIGRFYTTFLERVAKGRKLTVEQVDLVAQGRVWTGKDALNVGLVDQLGGLQDALAYLYKKLDIKKNEVEIKEFPLKKSKLDEIFSQLSPKYVKSKIINQILPESIKQNLPFLMNDDFKKSGIWLQNPNIIEINN